MAVNNYDYAYTEELYEKAAELLESKVASTPTQAAKMICKENELEYNEAIGRQYRRVFGGNNLLLNSTGYQEAINRELPKSAIYFLTSAQNNTPVHENLLSNMEVYAKDIHAQIGVIASRYRNPNLYDEGLKDNYWDKSIKDYLIASRYKLHDNLVIGADVFIPYTTKYPLNSAQNLVGDFSFVVGHPKQDFRPVPTLDNQPDKYLYSTGSITLPSNYSQSMRGSEAQRHHKLGFIIVILAGDRVVVRNVEADVKGNFQDLGVVVKDGKVLQEKGKVEAMVLGDIHVLNDDPKVKERTNDLIDILNPKEIVLHDVLSAESISFFTRRDIFRKLELIDKGQHELNTEIDAALKYIQEYRQKANIVIPRANHHNFLDQWLTREDWKKDAHNARIYLELARVKSSQNVNQEKGVFALLVDSFFATQEGNKVKTLSYNESYRVKGIELGQHGDKGANGRRGSARQYELTGIPHIVAHIHSPEMRGDILFVGTSTQRRLGYNQGYSSWRAVHAIITENGKKQYIQL